jgi:aminodeoxyfutalosine deaminase
MEDNRLRDIDFVRRLPKAELHLHLEGSIEPSTLVELSQRVDEVPLTLEEAQKIYEYDDFLGFLNAFFKVVKRLTGPTEYEIAAERMMQRLAQQGVVHAEVFFAVGELLTGRSQLNKQDSEIFEEYLEAIERARVRCERELGITVYWIIDTSRHNGPELAQRVFTLAAQYKQRFPSIIGIGLGGDESRQASEPFRQLFREAAAAGLRLTNHAGECTPSSFIWEALDIGSERIGHALSAVEDPKLVAELKSRQIPLEMNPTSNVVCKNFKGTFAEHPMKTLFEQGLFVTLNSDDPAFFGSNIENEYLLARTEMNFSLTDLKKLAANSFRGSFMPDSEKERWVATVEALAT